MATVESPPSAPREPLSLQEVNKLTEERILREQIKFSERFHEAMKAHDEFEEQRERLITFLEKIGERFSQEKGALIALGIPSEQVESRFLQSRKLRDEYQKNKTFAPHRQSHEKIRRQLLSDKEDGITLSAFRRYVLSSESAEDDWLLETFQDDVVDVLRSSQDEVEQKCRELERKIEDYLRSNPQNIPQHLRPFPLESIGQFVYGLPLYAGYDQGTFIPLPKSTVNGMFGIKPSEATMHRIFDDYKQLEALPDAERASIEVVAVDRVFEAYGAKALLNTIRTICEPPQCGRIVDVTIRKDDDVRTLLEGMSKGQKLIGKSRENESPVEVLATDSDDVELNGLSVSPEDFLKAPMKYLAHEFRFATA